MALHFAFETFTAVTDVAARFEVGVVALVGPLPIKRTTGIAPAPLLQHPRKSFVLILLGPVEEYGVRYSSFCAVVELKLEFSISLIPACIKSMFRTSRFTL